jgi:hypothetical protein
MLGVSTDSAAEYRTANKPDYIDTELMYHDPMAMYQEDYSTGRGISLDTWMIAYSFISVL